MLNIDEFGALIAEIESQDETTFYTADGEITCPRTNVKIFSDYEGLCNDWLNTGLHESEAGFRTSEDEEFDRNEYYDYIKDVWFACW